MLMVSIMSTALLPWPGPRQVLFVASLRKELNEQLQWACPRPESMLKPHRCLQVLWKYTVLTGSGVRSSWVTRRRSDSHSITYSSLNPQVPTIGSLNRGHFQGQNKTKRIAIIFSYDSSRKIETDAIHPWTHWKLLILLFGIVLSPRKLDYF